MEESCRGKCRFARVKTVTRREYHGSPSEFTDTVVVSGTICELDGMCVKLYVEQERAARDDRARRRHRIRSAAIAASERPLSSEELGAICEAAELLVA